jgi:hypothetical protein
MIADTSSMTGYDGSTYWTHTRARIHAQGVNQQTRHNPSCKITTGGTRR